MTEGLQPGDRVIVEGLQKVRPGSPVNPVEWVDPMAPAKAPAETPAAAAPATEAGSKAADGGAAAGAAEGQAQTTQAK